MLKVLEFSETPAGRYRTDGPDSGERFRQEILVPALRSSQKIVIDLDDVEGYGSSFLEEAFGGLVRVENFSAPDLLNRLSFISEDDPLLVRIIKSYINDAK